jgi:hypothetical protein
MSVAIGWGLCGLMSARATYIFRDPIVANYASMVGMLFSLQTWPLIGEVVIDK